MNKKNFIAILVLIFSFCLILSVSAQVNLANLILLKGKVLYKLPDQKQYERVTGKAISLPEKSTIQVMEESSAKVIFPDGSTMFIGENTILKLTTQQSAEKEQKIGIKLIGKIYMNVKKAFKKNEYKIETPTALATIRGTKANILVEKNLFTKIAVIEGNVDTVATYLTKGTVQKVMPDYLVLETQEGSKKVNILPDTIIATRIKKDEIKPVTKQNYPPATQISSAGLPLISLKDSDYGIKMSDNLVIYGQYVSASEVNAGTILFGGKDLSNNTFTAKDLYTFVETPPVQVIPSQPVVTVTTGMGTSVGPAAPPQAPAPAPIFVPTTGAEGATGTPEAGGSQTSAATSTSEPQTTDTQTATGDSSTTTSPTTGGTTGPAAPGATPPVYNPSPTGNWQIIIQ